MKVNEKKNLSCVDLGVQNNRLIARPELYAQTTFSTTFYHCKDYFHVSYVTVNVTLCVAMFFFFFFSLTVILMCLCILFM